MGLAMNEKGTTHPSAEDLPAEATTGERVRVLDVDYVHVALDHGDDLYLTEYGLDFADLLRPENFWTDLLWRQAHASRLAGSSTLFKVRTKVVAGRHKDIVLKWNRMGQDVPGETLSDEADAEFNSPFEEFSLALELREVRRQSPGRLRTHKPLAIYVPGQRVDLERLGRKAYKFQAKRDSHEEIDLDPCRKYAVIYEWVKGIDAAEAQRDGLFSRQQLYQLVLRVRADMMAKGFVVHDNKPQHVIVRRSDSGELVRDRAGQALYAMIDFELLERTPDRERAVRASKRKDYLVRQARRFEPHDAFPPNLHPVRLLDVDYVYGRTESTGGALWVVGKDPELFDYFLPEKWRRTPRTKLSVTNQIYETTTKDNVHLVWRVSKIGEQPDMDPFRGDERQILAHGYNSPFEEIALSMALNAQGIETVYPRAIYMTGDSSQMSAGLSDDRRYERHSDLVVPGGEPVLRRGHDYVILWGYWNAPDEILAVRDEDLYQSVNALSAYRDGLIDETAYLRLMQRMRERLAEVGIEDLNLRGNHLLLSINREETLVTDDDGLPTVRICNFELLKRTDA